MTTHNSLQHHCLEERQIRFWEENGYFISDVLFRREEMEEAGEHMGRVFDQEYETNVPPNKIDWLPGDPETEMKKVDNAWWADYVIRRLVQSPVIGSIAAQLSRSDKVRLFQDQLLHKPGIGPDSPRSGSVGWHQDWSYWKCTRPDHALTARISVDGETLENGCMRVVPSSCHWPLQSTKMFFQSDATIEDLPEFEVPDGENIEVELLELKPGQVSFHHSRTIHGSGENRTENPRRTIIVHMLPGDTRYQSGTGDHPWAVAVLASQTDKELKDGDLWAGDRFPVIYSQGESSNAS